MIDRTKAVIAAVIVVLTARASADTCDQLRQDIARVTATLRSEQDALDRCRQRPVGCSVSDLQRGVALASEELAALRARLPTCTPLPPHPAPRFRITELSPSALYRSDHHDGDADPAGRVLTVVVDPVTPTTLYAASEFAGVWKSVDAAQTWTQASHGLTMSELAEPGGMTPVLAIDERDPRRLVLAAGHDDFRDTQHAATSLGIWVSTDAAATWRHASIVGQTSCAATRVAFAAGQGYAVTSCGIATASSDLTRWTVLAAPFTVDRNSTYIAARGAQLFACDGTTVRVGAWSRAVPAPRFTWGASAPLAGCQGLAAAPSTGAAVVVAIHGDATKLDVSTVQFASPPTVTSLALGGAAACCGTTGVFVAPRLGDAATPYDVFASTGFQFLQYAPATGSKPATWSALTGIHADTWSMAFPATYDPRHGRCAAYASSDGGVSVSAVTTPGRACVASSAAFQRAQRGLYVFGATGIVGVHGPCGTPQRDCFGLYVAGPDNGTWGFRSGGATSAWASMGCCGDSGTVTADWAAPWLVATGRNNGRTRWDGKNQPPVASSDPVALETLFPRQQFPTNPPMPDRNEPPQQATFSQLQTLTAELRANPNLPQIVNGDYFQIITVPKTTQSPGGDTVFRLSDATRWTDIAPGHPFSGQQLTAIATAGGHEHAMVFAIGDGLLWRRSADSSAGGWQDASGRTHGVGTPLRAVGDVWVNPDNAKQLYVTDTTDQRIRTSTDGGDSWHDDTALTGLATHGGEFQAGCFGSVFAGRRFCSLQQMLFVRDRSDFRIAILFPGGIALTRDGGQHWRSLEGFAPGALTIHALGDLIAHPYAGYLETGPGDTFSLYLAMRGRGVVRIDGSF